MMVLSFLRGQTQNQNLPTLFILWSHRRVPYLVKNGPTSAPFCFFRYIKKITKKLLISAGFKHRSSDWKASTLTTRLPPRPKRPLSSNCFKLVQTGPSLLNRGKNENARTQFSIQRVFAIQRTKENKESVRRR